MKDRVLEGRQNRVGDSLLSGRSSDKFGDYRNSAQVRVVGYQHETT